jgi:hypothetical protein
VNGNIVDGLINGVVDHFSRKVLVSADLGADDTAEGIVAVLADGIYFNPVGGDHAVEAAAQGVMQPYILIDEAIIGRLEVEVILNVAVFVVQLTADIIGRAEVGGTLKIVTLEYQH